MICNIFRKNTLSLFGSETEPRLLSMLIPSPAIMDGIIATTKRTNMDPNPIRHNMTSWANGWADLKLSLMSAN
jgi:hypothetical protein